MIFHEIASIELVTSHHHILTIHTVICTFVNCFRFLKFFLSYVPSRQKISTSYLLHIYVNMLYNITIESSFNYRILSIFE
ncbi:unnamed protein product [Rotaria magnacalcarata]